MSDLDFLYEQLPNVDEETRAAYAEQHVMAGPVAAVKAPPKPEPKGPMMLKFTATRTNLLAALSDAAEVTPTKPTRPALACVALDTTGPGLVLHARADNEAIERRAVTMSQEPGRVLVHARDLLRRVEPLAEGEIEIREVDGKIQVKQGKSKATLSTLNLDDAPTFASVEPTGGAIPGKVLASLLSRLAPIMSADPARPSIYGVKFTTGGGALRGFASNGHCLARASVTFDGSLSVFVPAPAVAHIRRMLAKSEEEVRIAMVGRMFYVFGEGFAYSTQLTDDGVSDYAIDSIVNSPKKLRAILAREDFATGIEFARTADPGGGIQLRPSAGSLTLRAFGEAGVSSRTIPGDVTIQSATFAAEYLLRGAGLFTGATLELWLEPGEREVKGCSDPLVFRSPGSEDIFVAMPLRYTAEDLAPDTDEAA